MKKYEITFYLKSPISFLDAPKFDSIITWCFIKDKLGYVPQKLIIAEEELIFTDIPISVNEDNLFLASYMMYEENGVEHISYFHKQWNQKDDHLVDFGKAKRKLEINKGDYKSYSFPFSVKNLPKVWFRFYTDNLEEIKRLIDNYLYALGKKTGAGYGIIDYYLITETEEKFVIPIPAKEVDLSSNTKIEFIAYKPPYWLPENHRYCKFIEY